VSAKFNAREDLSGFRPLCFQLMGCSHKHILNPLKMKISVTYVCRFYRTAQQTCNNYKNGPINAVFMEKSGSLLVQKNSYF
jgi:hypothetical protein